MTPKKSRAVMLGQATARRSEWTMNPTTHGRESKPLTITPMQRLTTAGRSAR